MGALTVLYVVMGLARVLNGSGDPASLRFVVSGLGCVYSLHALGAPLLEE